MITVLQLAPTRRLTRTEHVVRELGPAVASPDEPYIATLIDAATAAIERFTHRPEGFGRDEVRETVRGFGGSELQLARAPIVAVSSVTRDGEPVLGWSIESHDQATVYLREGWGWTASVQQGLAGARGRGWPGFGGGVPMPGSEEPAYSVTYTCGYLLPGQALEGVATLEAIASDNNFRDTAGRLPALLQAGDVLVTSGFSNAANNGRFLVTGTTGTGATRHVQVAAQLVAEAAGGTRSLSFESVGGGRSFADVEAAAVETVKAGYLSRGQDRDTVELQMGATRVRRSEAADTVMLALPPIAVGLLRPWIRSS